MINSIHTESNLETMARMKDNFIDLTVTSPPYDNLRTYNGYEFDFESIAKELFRVTKDGGVVVWVVGDATIKGSETGTSFRQALFFMECGFNLHDTMIYQFAGTGAKGSNRCYWQNFEYMFVFSKSKIKTVNRIKDHKNVKFGSKNGQVGKFSNGTRKERGLRITPEFSVRPNVWRYGGSCGDKTIHTAQFPEKLANDHIMSWSNEKDLVYDPFMGSGTTAKMAILNNRRYIGSEISQEYTDLAVTRINEAKNKLTLFSK